MTTQNPRTPDTLPVLYADEYGTTITRVPIHTPLTLTPQASTTASASGAGPSPTQHPASTSTSKAAPPCTSLLLTPTPTTPTNPYPSGWSAYLNGHFLGSHLGTATTSQANKTLLFPAGTLRKNTTNTILVIHDDTGHDQTTGALNPRGILAARLLAPSDSSTAPNFTQWRVAGTAGGESDLDPVRGVYNEDGLFAERMGWHLPGFDDADWPANNSTTTRGAQVSLSVTGATVRFFRAVVPLHLPRGVDASISFVLGTPAGASTAYRAQLFVNGYQYGRYYPHIGNQVVYPVPAGVLNYDGENTIGVAVWAQSEAGAEMSLDWRVNYVADSSLDAVKVAAEGTLRPGWSEERLQYA